MKKPFYEGAVDFRRATQISALPKAQSRLPRRHRGAERWGRADPTAMIPRQKIGVLLGQGSGALLALVKRSSGAPSFGANLGHLLLRSASLRQMAACGPPPSITNW
ncbi:MAG: hypothetical protein R2867_44810 [Caldilineaceae bacterium]